MAEHGESRAAVRQRGAELAVAALFFAVGAIVIFDSVRLGIRWQEVHGPQAGYFPFYIGLIMCLASLVNMAQAIVSGRNGTFVQVDQLRLVLAVLVPTALYAAVIGWIGIYAASVLFIAFFMRWLGKYPWWKVAAVSLGTAAVFFLIFERWFLVPLPKGPVEALLGLA